jgi:transposase-like protein
VRRTTEPGMSVSLVAREAGISSGQLFQWRKAYLEGSLVAVGASEPVPPMPLPSVQRTALVPVLLVSSVCFS